MQTRYAVFICFLCSNFFGGWINAQPQSFHQLSIPINENGFMGGTSLITYGASKQSVASFAGIWISAIHPNLGIQSAIMLDTNKTDFTYGIYDSEWGVNRIEDFRRTWFITQSDIQQHIKDYKLQDYVMPSSISEWPANAPPRYRGPLAGFYDWNTNGIYEPLKGEYPYIEGDKTVYAIYNDMSLNRAFSGTTGIGITCKHSVYNYDNILGEIGKGLVMNRLVITNNSDASLSSIKLGVYVKTKIGLGDSGYVRSFPPFQSIAAYSVRQNDSTAQGKAQPLFGLMGLNPGIQSAMYVLPNEDPVTGLPSSAIEIDNYLSGKWKNGKRLSYGGNGVDGTDPCRFVFPNDLDANNNQFPWTEENSGIHAGERGILLSFEAIDLQPFQSQEYRFAIITSANNADSIDAMLTFQSVLESVFSTYKEGRLTSVQPKFEKNEDVRFFPNPASLGQKISIKGALNYVQCSIIDVNGKYLSTLDLRENGGDFQIMTPSHPGIYWVKLESEVSQKMLKLIVVN